MRKPLFPAILLALTTATLGAQSPPAPEPESSQESKD